ncbi:MAG: ATP synthase F1 subunit epsilon [Planctomycetes bacterium]|nr:ATP synthase F1 subunit epsilon [Planctomycetota bacterium]
MAAELHLRIVTPDRTVVDRKVAGASFLGLDGSYGVLPKHAPMLTVIGVTGFAQPTETDGKTSDLFLSDGFAQVQGNVLTLVCEAGEAAAEIDMARVKAAEAKAREKLAGLDKLSQEYIKAEASLRKALARELLSRRTTGSGNLSN